LALEILALSMILESLTPSATSARTVSWQRSTHLLELGTDSRALFDQFIALALVSILAFSELLELFSLGPTSSSAMSWSSDSMSAALSSSAIWRG